MAEETKKDENAETVPEAPATGADAPETAGADVVLEGETAVPAGNEDAGLDPVEALIAERDSLKDQLLRALADVENMRRRTEREMETARKYGHTGFARDLVGAIDNLARAVEAAPKGEEAPGAEAVDGLVTGIEMSWQEIQATMERHGIRRISPKGEKFDYNFHQAMFEMPRPISPPEPWSRSSSMDTSCMTGCSGPPWSVFRRLPSRRKTARTVRKRASCELLATVN